jgi:phosphoribosylglycinamide formyltransferase 1
VHRSDSTLKVAIFASGEGTTLEAIARECATGRLRAEVVVVVCNNRDSGALRRAKDSAIPFAHLSSVTHPEPDDLDMAILGALAAAKAEIVILAGYMKKIGPRVLNAFAGRIINTHPALLPKFGGRGMYGSRVHEAVLAAGETTTGVSVHVVTGEYDAGPVIAQTEVSVREGDTVTSLSERVQGVERAFLISVLQSISTGAVRLSYEENNGCQLHT